MPRIKKLIVSKIISDQDISKREGTWFTEDDLVHPVIRNNIDVSYIPIDTSNAETFINYLIPINILHSLLLIYLFHSKNHLSLKFFIVSNITLVLTSYLFFGIPIDIFYIVPYLVFNFIYYNKRKKVFIH